MLAASGAFALLGTLVKVVSAQVPTGELVAWRSLVTAGLVLLFVGRSGASLRPVNLRMHLFRGSVGVGSMFCYFTAIGRLPLGDAVLLTYLSPIVVALLSPWTVGETPSRRVWVALLLGVLGVALVVGPGSALDPLGVAAGLCAAVFAASAYLSIRVLTRTDGTAAIVFWFSAIGGALASASFLDGAAPLDGETAALLVAIGALGGLAQAWMTRAYARVAAAQVSVYAYATPVLAYGLGLLILGEVPRLPSLLGAATVVLAGVVVAREGVPPGVGPAAVVSTR